MKLLLLLPLLCAGCTNPKEAQRVLTGAGYTNVTVTGYKWFACGERDFYHTGFEAKGPTGLEVKGCVCSGLLFKNSTIRFE